MGELEAFKLNALTRMFAGMDVALAGLLFARLPQRKLIAGKEDVGWGALEVEFGDDGVGTGIHHEIVGALEGESAKEAHIDLVFDVGEHVGRNYLEWNFVFGEEFNVGERLIDVLLGDDDAKMLSFAA